MRNVKTDLAGNYGTNVRARINGAFRAVPGIGQPSPPNRIRVRSQASSPSR